MSNPLGMQDTNKLLLFSFAKSHWNPFNMRPNVSLCKNSFFQIEQNPVSVKDKKNSFVARLL